MFHSGLCPYLRKLFHSPSIMIPIMLLYCQLSFFFGVLDKGLKGIYFTGVLYLGVDGLCLFGKIYGLRCWCYRST